MQTFNIYQTYVEKNDLWMVILSAEAFAIFPTTNRQNVYSPGQLVFGRDMILPIKHRVDWELISQKNQSQINKYSIRKIKNSVDHDYKVGDNVMLNNHTAYKY